MTTVEKMAREMHDAVNATGEPWRYRKGDEYCEAQMTAALAALKALREPSGSSMIAARKMVKAKAMWDPVSDVSTLADAAVIAFIDHAIQEHEG